MLDVIHSLRNQRCFLEGIPTDSFTATQGICQVSLTRPEGKQSGVSICKGKASDWQLIRTRPIMHRCSSTPEYTSANGQVEATVHIRLLSLSFALIARPYHKIETARMKHEPLVPLSQQPYLLAVEIGLTGDPSLLTS